MTTQHERTMCPQSLEKSNILGCVKRNMASKAKEVILFLYSGKASSDVLCPDVESSVQERYRPVGMHSEKHHKNGARDETPLLIRTVCESWGCSAWRREGSGET
mgnify:CR=1 FL=1